MSSRLVQVLRAPATEELLEEAWREAGEIEMISNI